MSFSADIFRNKLDLLQETQDSIVSISQWVLFHHRRAKELCQIWSDYILSSTQPVALRKKLSLLYLCNDVVQQARHKRKPEFIELFAACLPQVFNTIYSTTDDTIKPKYDRLISVWEQRGIFSASVIRTMRRAIDLLKAGKSLSDSNAEPAAGSTKPAAAGPQIATELVHLNNLYNHLNKLLEVSQSNLTQIAHQSKAYLPTDTEQNDNLPLPRVYISKLNVLEKLCNMTTKTILDIKTSRNDILNAIAGLQKNLQQELSTDDTKEKIIAQRLNKLNETRSSLQEMLDEEASPQDSLPQPSRSQPPPQEEDEEPSPSFEPATNNNEDDDLVPTYENSDSDDDDDDPPRTGKSSHRDFDEPEPKRSKSTDSTSSVSSKKSVAFSEDIQIKEYDREDQTGGVKVAKSDDEPEDDDDGNFEPQLPDNFQEYESKHKDDLELKKANEGDDGYEPGALGLGEEPKSGLLDLLSKLS